METIWLTTAACWSRVIENHPPKQAFMRVEDFARSSVTDPLQAPISKIWISQFDSGNIWIGLATDLAKHPIIFACICKNQCWTQLGGGQV
jgi:hypothetical protein